jgi:hypothetical protein
MPFRALTIDERNAGLQEYCEELTRNGWVVIEDGNLIVDWSWFHPSEPETYKTLFAMATLRMRQGRQLEWEETWCRVAEKHFCERIYEPLEE